MLFVSLVVLSIPIGWAVILPQMLAMLGGVFMVANTGDSVQKVVSLFVEPG